MAFNGNFMCTSFKKELLEAKHNFLASGGNTFNLALYTNDAHHLRRQLLRTLPLMKLATLLVAHILRRVWL